jgi:ABC-2 type transport system permease protein
MMKHMLKVAYARAYVRIKGTNRDFTHYIADVFLPLLGVSAILFAYKALNAPEIYLASAAVGASMIAFWYNILWSMASQFYWEKEQGNLPLFITSGAPLTGILLGMALGGAFNMTLRALGVLILTILLFNIKLNSSALLPTLGLFLLTLSSLYSLGMIFASSFLKFGRSVSKINELLGEPILFLSGVYFPINVFPLAIQILVSIIPLALGIEGMRELLILNKNFYDIIWVYIALIFLTIVFAYIAIKLLKKMENEGRITGSITLKWE